MTYKHIVLSGGGNIGLIMLGLLTETHKNKIWNIENIETIYSVSAGAVLGLILCLKIDFDTVNEYILERPYDFLKVETSMILKIISEKGLYDANTFKILFKPLLNSVDLTTEVTFKELYEYSKIDYNIILTELDIFNSVSFSHKTHPDMKVIEAITGSCGVPVIFKPTIINDKYYFDGGLFNNFPIELCKTETGCNYDEIIGFCKDCEDYYSETKVNNLLEYIVTIINKLLLSCSTNNIRLIKDKLLDNESQIYFIKSQPVTFYSILNMANHDYRKELFDTGVNIYNTYNISDNSNIDLSNVDLSNVNLSNVDLSNVDISNCNLENVIINDISLD